MAEPKSATSDKPTTNEIQKDLDRGLTLFDLMVRARSGDQAAWTELSNSLNTFSSSFTSQVSRSIFENKVIQKPDFMVSSKTFNPFNTDPVNTNPLSANPVNKSFDQFLTTVGSANTDLARYTVGTVFTPAALEDLRVHYTGKKGSISNLLRGLGGITAEARQVVGPALNELKDGFADAISDRKAQLELIELNKRLETEREDLTLPPRPEPVGALHPVMQVFEELAAIFADMGFAVAEGPDIEDDFHNFTALNFPPGHPARETHDTFFMKPAADGSRKLLRTHTSPVQIRAMVGNKPPIRVIAPGRVYRKDWDATHTPMFHQIEGLVVDKNVHMGHLKTCLTDAFSRFFEVATAQTRFRPHFFPFTEPSAEMDMRCDRSGAEIKVGEGNDWLEILGCGMVHPNVLKSCGIDPDEYQGFAFGLGVDRLAMLKYGMPDLRPYFEADVEWIRHYGFKPWLLPTVTGGLS